MDGKRPVDGSAGESGDVLGSVRARNAETADEGRLILLLQASKFRADARKLEKNASILEAVSSSEKVSDDTILKILEQCRKDGLIPSNDPTASPSAN